ncbi:MAG: response regulator [Candidatus Riflebacteria bacterium]|nr:response regulator [Candidatus Riflebacteria bacterium]
MLNNLLLAEQQNLNRILIVEDEPDISDFLYETLSLSGYEVDQARDGIEGLDKIAVFRPNMVLLDIMMPKMNGLEVCRRIRADENLRSTRVIFITAKGSLEEKLEGFQAGANDFIVKPFSSSELLARIEAHLRLDSLARDLELSEKRYRQLIEHSPDGILLFSDEKKLLFVNSRFKSMISIKSESMEPDTSINQLCQISPLFKEIDKLISKVQETRMIVSRTVATNFQRHLPSVLEIRGIPSELPGSRMSMVQVVMRDVTEKHNMDRILSRTEKINSLGILTAGIAHEINNPLTGISNAIQMLQKDTVSPQKRQEMLDLILNNISRITRIIEDLRVFSRQERLEADSFELVSIIEETIKLLRYQRENNQVEMLLQHDQQKYLIEGSKSQFQQLLLNLLLNAAQSIDSKGTVRIEVTQTQAPTPSAEIKIIDTGCGIPEDQLEQIFDPFFTTKRDWHGTGLGLAVAHRIVQLLKGSIAVTSKVNQGTTFTVTLPLLPES